MKKNLLFLLLLFAIKGFSQNPITVTPGPAQVSGAVINQWVNSNLVTNSCLVRTSNVNKTTGLDYGYEGVGSFTNTNPNFAFSRGVVLSTGRVSNAPGPNTSTSSDENAAWTGDADLEAAFAAGGITIQSMNATVLEFDFVAATNNLSIDYIFASEEYGQWQCHSKDGFAILLREASGGAYRNIATVPTTGQPVSVSTIRNNANISNPIAGCLSVNPEFFGRFNGGSGAAPLESPINYEGQTVVMNASSALVPGTTYHIKIVIADDGNGNPNNLNGNDGKFDSAVFFPDGAFNLGQIVLGEDLTLNNGDALCTGQTYTIDSHLNAASYDLSWTWNNGQAFAGDVSSIQVSQSGTYVLRISDPVSGCVNTQEIVVEFSPGITPGGTPRNLYACANPSGSYVYDLSQNTPVLKQGLDAATTVTYHASQTDAEQNNPPLNTNYNSTGGQTIWARVQSHNSSCYAVVSFQLLTVPTPTATAPAPYAVCETTLGGGTANFNLTQFRSIILGSQASADFTVSYHTDQNGADTNTNIITSPGTYNSADGIVYVRVQSNFSPLCYATTSFNIDVLARPNIGPVPTDQNVCTDFILPALPDGGAYYSQPGGLGSPIAVNTPITTSQRIYVYAQSTSTPACASEATFMVNIVSPANVPADVTACTDYTLPFLPSGQHYYNGPSASGGEIAGGTTLTQSQTVYFYIPAASGCTANTSFDVTIISANVPADVVAGQINVCSPYVLPAITGGGEYYTAADGPDGTGTPIAVSTPIAATQDIWVYQANPDGSCFAENRFRVVVTNTTLDPVGPITSCGPYTLPALTTGGYFSNTGGVGAIAAGTQITSSQRIYVYASLPGNPACTNEANFQVTINPLPAAPVIAPGDYCLSYTLPNLGPGITYFTTADATGIEYQPTDVITQSVTLYATTAPNASGCRATTSFRVTIIDTTIDAGPDQNQCERYILPALPTGNYYRQPNGVDRINAGTAITQNTRIYVYASNGTCSAQDFFEVNIFPLPVITPIDDLYSCGPYTLPTPQAGGHYYTGADGTGNLLGDNEVITTTQDIYLHVETGGVGTTPNCTADEQFKVTILDPNVSLAPGDVTTCGSYRLPALPVGRYFNQPNGVDPINTNNAITATQRVYVYVPTEGPNCTANNSFMVNITPFAIVPNVFPPVTACNSYVLPSLPAGFSGDYYLLTGGPAGGQTPISAGYVVDRTTTIFVHNNNTQCPSQRSFVVTINQVHVDNVTDQTVCENVGYVLPQLTTGKYYDRSGGPRNGAVEMAVGTLIDTAQRIYVYAEIPGTSPICSDEKFFDVIIAPAPNVIAPEPVDTNGVAQAYSCTSYTLPALTGPGAYYPQPDGQGVPIPATTVINATQLIYIYAQTGGAVNCSTEIPFQITVNPDAPVDVTECDEYILPALLPGQHYYTAAGGPGAGNTEIMPGTPINATQDVYFYITSAAACTANTFFTVTINNTPVLASVSNISVCEEYYLPALTVGAYYEQPNGAGTPIDINFPITAPAGTVVTKTVYVYAETGTLPNCAAQATFDVVVTGPPAINSFSNVETCDSYTLGALLPGVTYQSDSQANGGGSVIPVGTTFSSGSQTVYIYAPSPNANEPTCFSESSFTINIYSANADTILQPGQPGITACDSFTLPANGASGNPIDQNGPTFIQHYYLTDPSGTGNTGNFLPAGYTVNFTSPADDNINQKTVNVYIYQQLTGRFQCESVVVVPITIYRTPAVPDVPNQEVCFDYTLPALPALPHGDTDVTYDYYTRPGGPNGGGTVLNVGDRFEATGNTTRTETFYVYAYTGNNQCFSEDTYTVNIHSIEVPTFQDPTYACETYVLPILPLGEYFTGTGRTGTMLAPGTPLTNSVSRIYINGETSTTPACQDETSFELIVVRRPVAITPSPVVVCALDDDSRWGEFDLTAAIAEALGTQPDVAATIHETQQDAEFNVRALTGAEITNYRNVTAVNQTLYIRLTSTLPVDCYSITPVQLTVNPRPIANDLDPLEVCDNGVDDTDLIGVFNLTSVEADVLGATQAPPQYNVTYFTSRADAESATGTPIPNPATFTTVSTTVFVKVTNVTTGCYDIAVLELIVNPMPVANLPQPLTVCDENAPGDEIEEFDLTTKIDEITGGANGVRVNFYHTFIGADDELATDEITNPETYRNNTSPGVESIFVRVTDVNSGCYRIVILDIRVEALPTLTVPTAADLTICDTDGNGYGNFNLDDLVADMIGVGGPNIVVHFYHTEVGAINDSPNSRIVDTANYINQNPFAQTIWVRAEDTRTGCLSIVYRLDLVVTPAPQVPDLDDLRDCDDNDSDDQDGFAEFDLTQQNAVILAEPGMNPAIIIRYFASEQYANDGTPVIVTPQRFRGFNGQVIWVRIENPGFDCYSITSFELRVDTPVDVARPTALVLCDEALPNDGRTEFNLRDKDEEILGATGQGQDNVVTYYANIADLNSNTPITNPETYTNVVNPQTLQVKVTTIFGCESFTTLTIRVNPLPTPNFTPDALEKCDINNPGDLEEVFDLTEAAVDIRDNGNYILRYYPTKADADDDENELTLAEAQNYLSGTTTVGVRVEIAPTQPNDPTCFQTVELPLIVNPLPFVNPLEPYGICQTNFTGIATFDLDNYRYVILGTGVNLADYTVRYYADDPNMVPPGIGNPSLSYSFTNTVVPSQPIYVQAENLITGCVNTGVLLLSVEPQTIANPLDNNLYTKCDRDGDNDGETVIDAADLAVIAGQIVGTQGPVGNYDVTLYPSELDALAGTNAFPIPFTTTSVTDVWAEIRNNQYPYGCPAYVGFDIIIEMLPEPVITSADGRNISCVDFVTGAVYNSVDMRTQYLSVDGYTFQWYLDGVAMPGETNEFLSVTESGIYTVEVVGPGTNFCPSLPSPGFEVTKSGPASLINDGYVVSNAFAENQSITVLVEGFGDYQFSMYENGPWQNSNVFTNVGIGYHTIYIRDITAGIDACITDPIENVSTIDYPKFFTPNADGYNDFWNVRGLANFPSSQIFIFDRFGKLIKQLSPASNPEEGEGWDGTFNGAPLPADDYWFTVTFPEGNTTREYKAHFALKR
ncbi:T9SS type B sorting domain-containing protein [Flavobacterium sp. Sd200]|uniref:T9SS type B sorting domain-containing protein n=1 Tax=Flavobacterium sp. Sd200 TaxID=2692211 RepID=UPI00136AC6A4|nr:T9SS type B sorting domain-containing protein [Flavobacterium sp. Sd200]MXN93083.1 T9SS type B sorting domain-containing protein [Flavobacterium sp. Sd200]